MLNVAMPKVRLGGRPRVVPFVGECVTASVSEHVRVCFETELCSPAYPLDHAGEPGGGEGCPVLLGKDKRRFRALFALKLT